MTTQNNKIKIVEVGPRDGLQNESKHISLDIKFKLITDLLKTGLTHIEMGSFVSEKKVPSMKDTGKLCLKLQQHLSKQDYSMLSALVPNLQGLQKALSLKVKEIAVFISSTESFSQKNINCSIAESLKKVTDIIKLCQTNKIKVRGYVSTVFGCPYQGLVPLSEPLALTKKLFDLGVYEVSLGDTIGAATPKQVKQLLDLFKKDNCDLSKIAMHFHDTQSRALDNICLSLKEGVRIFDSSIAGLGGCPYADGATGNVATEDVLKLLKEKNYFTGIDLKKIDTIAKDIKKELK